MTEPCKACAIAVSNPFTGMAHSGCYGCTVRSASQTSKHFRQLMISTIAQADGEAAATQFIADVNAEFARRQAVRRTQ